mmetsp:Transcript_4224/g.5258  ORF Transcript_4224/g.5258 Transcript_4224/m.5258 type:complete len:121 (+) Transcript_4224:546-908(+)
MQRRRSTSRGFYPNELLMWRLWKGLLDSQLGYFAALIMIVWNYNALFYYLLQLYGLYSAFACLQAVINSPVEKGLAVLILVLAKAVQLVTSYALQPFLLSLCNIKPLDESIAAITSIDIS